jgi:RNA polymerase-binding transcription factor
VDTAMAGKRLEQARDELDRSIAVLRGEKPDGSEADAPHDPADAGTRLSEADRTEAVLASASTQRAQVLNALRRIQEGTYGTCLDCGALIPEGRLEARPEASRCVKCQAKWDRRH